MKKSKKLKRLRKGDVSPETEQNILAFEQFVKCGANASYKTWRLLAEKYGVSAVTIRAWYLRYDWKSRAAKLDRERKRTMSDENYREVIYDVIKQFKENLASGKVVIKHVQDFEKVAKIDALLRMKGTENRGDAVVHIVSSMPRPQQVVSDNSPDSPPEPKTKRKKGTPKHLKRHSK